VSAVSSGDKYYWKAGYTPRDESHQDVTSSCREATGFSLLSNGIAAQVVAPGLRAVAPKLDARRGDRHDASSSTTPPAPANESESRSHQEPREVQNGGSQGAPSDGDSDENGGGDHSRGESEPLRRGYWHANIMPEPAPSMAEFATNALARARVWRVTPDR